MLFLHNSWCLASSPLAKIALGLLGPTSAVWFWQVWRAIGYTSDVGAQTNIARAKSYAGHARWLLIPVTFFWVLTLCLYAGSYVGVKGKGCDASFNGSSDSWIMWFLWSLIPLTVSFIALAYQHLQFKRYDEAARNEIRSGTVSS
jgi:hypothetical protein